jgi:hypothetical protein
MERHSKEANILAYIERCKSIKGDIQFKREAKKINTKK